ncbi:MAG: aromatic ring-hydroxylating dioxygenase subunit alpha, partial [Rhodospirillales bacterium]
KGGEGLGAESILVVRGADGKVRAFHNVCRHRGSRICREPAGHASALVCPYHAWTYDLQGRLMRDTTAEHGVDRRELGLVPVALREAGGLIFVNLGADEDSPLTRPAARAALSPASGGEGQGAEAEWAEAEKALATALKPQGLARAKVAAVADYSVAANWKLVWENNRECMHCPTAHKEYIAANYDIYLGDPKREAEIRARTAECAAEWARKGLEAPSLTSDMTGAWYRANRTPLRPGFVSETLDGRRAAPLMGAYPDEEVGTLRLTLFPSFWMHGSCDHAVTTRVIPAGPMETRVRVAWLVDENAVEGRDYALDRLMPFWQRTSEQDWALVENVQKGVLSRAYRPGPLSKTRERNVMQFLDWYLGRLGAKE